MGTRRRGASRSDVAELAGVAPPTVSLVLNGRADQVRVSKATQQRVLAAARELRYVPNSAARAMVGQRYLTIGIIAVRPLGTLHVPSFEDFTVAALDHAALHLHNVKFLPPVSESDSYDVVEVLRDAHVDGILVHNLPWLARSLADWRVPTVYVGFGEEPQDLPVGQIGAAIIDDCLGMRAAAAHLAEAGHRRVAVIAGPTPHDVPLLRLRAFADEFKRAAGDRAVVHHVNAADWSPEGGHRAMGDLVGSGLDVTAVHVASDLMAVGAIRAIHEAGLQIPHDTAVVGFGDFRVSGYLEPPLTTVRWPLSDLATQAIDLLLAQLNGQSRGFERVALPTELVIRASSRAQSG